MVTKTLSSYTKSSIDVFLEEIEGFILLSEREKAKIRLVYSFADLLHHDETRKDKSPYFEHPKEVAKTLKKITDPSASQIIIALLHDLIENTAVEYYLLKHLFWVEIANWVRSISKKCWTLYLKDVPQDGLSPEDIERIKSLKWNDPIHQILTPEEIDDNEVNVVFSGSNFSEKQQKIQSLLDSLIHSLGEHQEKVFDIIIIDCPNSKRQEISEFIANVFQGTPFDFKVSFHEYVKKDSLPIYAWFPEKVKALARRERDKDYFENMENLPDFVLDVKFADRIHNLETTSWLSDEKKAKLLRETQLYFLPVAKKRNQRAWNIMRSCCSRLVSEIFNSRIGKI